MHPRRCFRHPSPYVKSLLENQQLNGIPVLLSTTSDLSLTGDVRPHWVVATRENLAVVADGAEPRLVDPRAARARAEVPRPGRDRLRLPAGLRRRRLGRPGPLLEHAGHAVPQAGRQAGRPPHRAAKSTVDPAEQVDSTHCPKCGLQLPAAGESCPRCLPRQGDRRPALAAAAAAMADGPRHVRPDARGRGDGARPAEAAAVPGRRHPHQGRQSRPTRRRCWPRCSLVVLALAATRVLLGVVNWAKGLLANKRRRRAHVRPARAAGATSSTRWASATTTATRSARSSAAWPTTAKCCTACCSRSPAASCCRSCRSSAVGVDAVHAQRQARAVHAHSGPAGGRRQPVLLAARLPALLPLLGLQQQAGRHALGHALGHPRREGVRPGARASSTASTASSDYLRQSPHDASTTSTASFSAIDGAGLQPGRADRVVRRRPRRAGRPDDARLADGVPRLPGDVLRAAVDAVAAHHLAHQLPDRLPARVRAARHAGRDARPGASPSALPQARGRSPVRKRVVRLRAPPAGAQGRRLHDPPRRDDRHRRPQRQRQDDAREPASAGSTTSTRAACCSTASTSANWPPTDLRRHVGVVLQEPFLFRGTICDNLVYGRPDARRPSRRSRPPRAAQAHDFILRTPLGYDTWLGERGAGLSGGERQRALDRPGHALRPARSSILDEATSSVDTESEQAIQERSARAHPRPHDDGHRPPAEHAPRIRPHPRVRPRPADRARHAPRADAARRQVRPARENPNPGRRQQTVRSRPEWLCRSCRRRNRRWTSPSTDAEETDFAPRWLEPGTAEFRRLAVAHRLRRSPAEC